MPVPDKGDHQYSERDAERVLSAVLRLRRLDRDDAKGIVHEAFIAAQESFDASLGNSLTTLWTRIAFNMAIDALSKRGRRDAYWLRDVEARKRKEEVPLLERLVLDEQASQIQEAVAALPFAQQEVFRLRLESTKQRLIAERLGIGVNDVRRLYTAALNELRKKLGKLGDD